MSLFAHRPGTLFLLIFTIAYFLGLAAALVWLRLGPEYILALTVGAIGIVVMAFRPYVAIQIFLLVLFFENAVGKAGNITVMKALGVIILAGWLASIMMQRRIGVSRSALLIAMLCFLAWAGVCVLGALDARIGLVQFVSFAQLVLSAIMFNSVVRSLRHLRGVQIGFLAWTVVATLVAIAMYYAGATRVAVGFVGNRNLLAIYINLGIVCALLTLPTIRSRLGQLAIALSLPILFLGMALTLSRTGIVIMILALLVVWYRLARHQGLLVLLGSATALAGLVFLLPGAFWERTESIVPTIERREDTFGVRVRIWEVGFRMIEDRPIMGVGPGNFAPASPRYARGEIMIRGLTAHNAYISAAAEMGLVGLGAFLTIIALGLMNCRRAFRRARDQGDRGLALGALAVEMMIWVMLGQGLTADFVQLKCFWLLLGLSLALHGLTSPLAAAAVAHAAAARTAPATANA